MPFRHALRCSPALASRTLRICRAALLLALWLATPPAAPLAAAESEPPPLAADALLPDLQTLPPSDLHIQVRRGRRFLRLANIVWNSGQGPLELLGQTDRRNRRTLVQQRIQTLGGESVDVPVGEFVYHPGHAHFHFPDFARYEIWRLTPQGDLDSVAVRSSKVSYCLMETDAVDRDRPDFPRRRQFSSCGRTRQGMQVGWGDEYDAMLDGQEIDITALADGFYALISTANPGGGLIESDYGNNAAVIYVQIAADQVIVIEPPGGPHAESCRPAGFC